MASSISRRSLAGTAGATLAVPAAASDFGNPDRPSEGAVNASPQALSDPGPQAPTIARQFPFAFSPPATDIGGMPPFWSSFNIAHRRIQDGGGARQVTQEGFLLSSAITGVNMRLAAGGIRELHWHPAAEWAYMTTGRCRITVMDTKGRAYVQDVGIGDLWYFPAGTPPSLQGPGPDGSEFLIAFADGSQPEYNTLLLSDWLAHASPEILATNCGVPADTFREIPLSDLWIFQGTEPSPLAADQAAVRAGSTPPEPFAFSLAVRPPLKETRSGSLRLADSSIFKASNTIAATLETIRPRGVGVVPRASGHYVQNTGDTDLVFVTIFRTAEYQKVSLIDWLKRTAGAGRTASQHGSRHPRAAGVRRSGRRAAIADGRRPRGASDQCMSAPRLPLIHRIAGAPYRLPQLSPGKGDRDGRHHSHHPPQGTTADADGSGRERHR
ncbi:cupin domain-containing protein [Neoroseomonas alba]|nr:cupin domain-containing protein [Neoroseomonas alba]